MMRHREAYAIEMQSPTKAAFEAERAAAEVSAAAAAHSASGGGDASERPERRRITVGQSPAASGELQLEGGAPEDILIVVSKLKKYIKARSGMNTSDAVMAVLSDFVREKCDEAIRNAAIAGRKTVLDRDFPKR